jgi:hypothetical protein
MENYPIIRTIVHRYEERNTVGYYTTICHGIYRAARRITGNGSPEETFEN